MKDPPALAPGELTLLLQGWSQGDAREVLALDAALQELAVLDARQGRLVERRFWLHRRRRGAGS